MLVFIENIWIWTRDFKASETGVRRTRRNARSILIEWHAAASLEEPELEEETVQRCRMSKTKWSRT